LKQAVRDVPEEKNKPPEEKVLSCNNNWLFDLEFLVNVIDHLDHLNIKLQGKNNLFPNVINHIKAFKMKLNLLYSQLENEDMSQFPYLKQIEGAVDNGNWENALKRSSYGETFLMLLQKKTQFSHLETHSSWTTDNENANNMQGGNHHFKTNSTLKMKFEGLSFSPVTGVCDVIDL